jgi:hypothetical protein
LERDGGASMSFFDIFYKKKASEDSQLVSENESTVLVPSGIKSYADFSIHEDIKNLLWIGDGEYQNYYPEVKIGASSVYKFFTITINIIGISEPSVITSDMLVNKQANIESVPKLGYYPMLTNLTPEQRWVYLKFLSNPYDGSFDIGYVFILYYGLERHLLEGNFENAAEVILKLRAVYPNDSFQHYSGRALVFSAMLRNKREYFLKFVLDKDENVRAPTVDMFLLVYYLLNLPLLPKDIVKMRHAFGFRNLDYISEHFEIFQKWMEEIMIKRFGNTNLFLSDILSDNDIMNSESKNEQIFANMSLSNTIPIPIIKTCRKFKKLTYSLSDALLESNRVTLKTKIDKQSFSSYCVNLMKEDNTLTDAIISGVDYCLQTLVEKHDWIAKITRSSVNNDYDKRFGIERYIKDGCIMIKWYKIKVDCMKGVVFSDFYFDFPEYIMIESDDEGYPDVHIEQKILKTKDVLFFTFHNIRIDKSVLITIKEMLHK